MEQQISHTQVQFSEKGKLENPKRDVTGIRIGTQYRQEVHIHSLNAETPRTLNLTPRILAASIIL
jgi:hypothetical protein